MGTKYVLRAAGDGRFKARLVTPGRMQRNDDDCAAVAVKDTFGRSRNGALDQGEKLTQHYGNRLGKVSRYSNASDVSGYQITWQD